MQSRIRFRMPGSAPPRVASWLAALTAALLASGCGDAGAGAESAYGGDFAAAADAGGSAGGGDSPGPGELPPENERTAEPFTRPAAGRTAVFVASPAADRVVRIDGRTLAIDVIEVGDEPTEVRARPGNDIAVVLNRGSDELSVVNAVDDVDFHVLPRHFNALTLSPDGRHAFCWFDLTRVKPGEDTSALQDLAVVDLDRGSVHAVVIGFRPREIVFTHDGGVALVVTEDGLSQVRLANLPPSSVAPTVPLSTDPFATADREVAVTPDGRYAVSRAAGEPGVTLVALSEGLPRFLPLGGQPTDLDLLPDGRTALVMLRGEARLALVSIEDALLDAESARFIDFDGQVLGSAAVSADGRRAVLYTTVAPEDARPQVSLLDLETGDIEHRPMRKGVAGVSIDPSGQVAFVLHTKAPGDPDPTLDDETFIARSHGYSLVDLSSAFTRLVTTPAEPSGLTFAGDAAGDEAPNLAFVLLNDPSAGVAEMQRIDLASFEVRRWDLGSPPEVVGVLPAVGRAFVTQTHPEGRISFVELGADADPGRLETVSGYTLNGRIE